MSKGRSWKIVGSEEQKAPDMNLADIDLNALETHWQELPVLFDEATRDIPDLRRRVSHSKLEIDEYYARSYKVYREIEEKGRKPTEREIDSRIITDPVFEKMQREHIEIQYRLAESERIVEILRRKSSALEGLGQLFSSQYWFLREKR